VTIYFDSLIYKNYISVSLRIKRYT